MGICSFQGAREIAALICKFVDEIFQKSNRDGRDILPADIGWLLGWFQIIFVELLEADRVNDSRVKDAIREHYTGLLGDEAKSVILSSRNSAYAELYPVIAASLPLSEDDREAVASGRAPSMTMKLAEAGSAHLKSSGFQAEPIYMRRMLLEFIRDSIWERIST